MIKVEIYTSDYCGYCNAAKAIFNKKGVEYTEINLSHDHELRIKLVEKHNWRTVPMIVINETLIGGYEQLVELERRGELDQLLSIETQG